jgi:hypothetical protein
LSNIFARVTVTEMSFLQAKRKLIMCVCVCAYEYVWI